MQGCCLQLRRGPQDPAVLRPKRCRGVGSAPHAGGPHRRGPGTALRRSAGSRDSLVVAGCLGCTRARGVEQRGDAMGRPFKQYLDGPRIYSCSTCRSHVADHDDIVSKVPTLTASFCSHVSVLHAPDGYVVSLGALPFGDAAMHSCSKWDIQVATREIIFCSMHCS